MHKSQVFTKKSCMNSKPKTLPVVLPEYDGSIMATKSEGVAQRITHGTLMRFVKSKVKLRIKGRIIRKMINSWRNDIVHHRHDGSNGFHGPGCSQQMAGHRFCRADVELVSVFPEH